MRVTKKKLKEEHGSLSAAVVAANSQNGSKRASATSTPAKVGSNATSTPAPASKGKDTTATMVKTTATGKRRGRPAGSRKSTTPPAAAGATTPIAGAGGQDGEREAIMQAEAENEDLDDEEEMTSPSKKVKVQAKEGKKATTKTTTEKKGEKKADRGVVVKAEPMNGHEEDEQEDGAGGLYGAGAGDSFEMDFLL